MKKLTRAQIDDLKEFIISVESEGFGYACSNYPLKDFELRQLICNPVCRAEQLFEELCSQYSINGEYNE